MYEEPAKSQRFNKYYIGTIQFLFILCYLYNNIPHTEAVGAHCTSYIPSLSNISLCTDDSCRFNQVVKVPQSNVRDSVSCFKVQHQGFDQVFKITVLNSIDTVTFDYCYVTGDNTFHYTSYCGCPLGSTVTCGSCPTPSGFYDYNSCYLGTHTSHQCILDYIPSARGTFCVKEFIHNNKDTLVCKVNKEASYNTEVEIDYLGHKTVVNVNTPARSVVTQNYTVEFFYDHVKTSLPDFIIWHIQDDSSLIKKAVYEASSLVVNDINTCDRNKVGWFKPYQSPPVCEPGSFDHYSKTRVVDCNRNQVDIVTQNISTSMSKFFKPTNFIIHNTGGFGSKQGSFAVNDFNYDPWSVGVQSLETLTIMQGNKAIKVNEFTRGITTFQNAWGSVTRTPQITPNLVISAHNFFLGNGTSNMTVGLGEDGNFYHCLNPTLTANVYTCQPVFGDPPVFLEVSPDHTEILVTYAGYRAFPKSSLTTGYRPSDPAIIDLTIKFDNVTINFQQKFTIGVLKSVTITNDMLIIVASSSTETGDCYVSAPTLLQQNHGVVLTQQDKTFTFNIDRFNNPGDHNVSLTCYNNVQSKSIYYNQSLMVEPIREDESFWESLIPDSGSSLGTNILSVLKLIGLIAAGIAGVGLLFLLLPVVGVLIYPMVLGGKWLWTNRMFFNSQRKRLLSNRDQVRKYFQNVKK